MSEADKLRLGPLHAARAGRDTTTEYLNRFGRGPNTASRSSS